jgi:hypothetical protein
MRSGLFVYVFILFASNVGAQSSWDNPLYCPQQYFDNPDIAAGTSDEKITNAKLYNSMLATAKASLTCGSINDYKAALTNLKVGAKGQSDPFIVSMVKAFNSKENGSYFNSAAALIYLYELNAHASLTAKFSQAYIRAQCTVPKSKSFSMYIKRTYFAPPTNFIQILSPPNDKMVKLALSMHENEMLSSTSPKPTKPTCKESLASFVTRAKL